MNLYKSIAGLGIVILMAIPVFAQSIKITNDLQTRIQQVRVIKIETPNDAKTKITFSDKNRKPIQLKKSSNGSYDIPDEELKALGSIWVHAIYIDFKNETFDDIETEIKYGDSVSPVPNPVPVPPDVEPVPVPVPSVYDGPNKFGLGKIAFDSAPSNDAAIADIFVKSGNFLFGNPQQKVIYIDPTDARSNTDYNLIIWIEKQMSPSINSNPEWGKFYDLVMLKLKELNKDRKVIESVQWYDAFNEIASGIKAKK